MRLLAMTRFPSCSCTPGVLHLLARASPPPWGHGVSRHHNDRMTLPLGLIGNCSYNALLAGGSVEWLCWPDPDSSFVFGPLLDRERGGAFVVEGVDTPEVRQEYIENTNVLRTVFSGRARLVRAPRLRAALRALRPVVQAVDARTDRAPARGQRPAARPLPARLRLRPHERRGLAGVQPHRVHRPPCAAPADDQRRRSATSRRSGRSCSNATTTSSSPGASRSRPASRRPPSSSSSGRSTTGASGSSARACRATSSAR